MESTQKLGIDDLKKVAQGIGDLGNIIATVVKEGHVGVADIRFLTSAIADLRLLSQVDLKALLPEAEDLDDQERAELAQMLAAEFNLQAETTEKTIEMGLEILSWGLSAIQMLERIHKAKTAPAASAPEVAPAAPVTPAS